MATDSRRESGREGQALLRPVFERAYWRSRERLPYRRHAGFSPKKKHFEPEEPSSHAERFARELAREPLLEEIHRVYENAVTLLGEKRSRMEKGEGSLEAPGFRYEASAQQDPADPSLVLYTRRLDVKTPLNELHEHFDDVFPWKPTEVVVPYDGAPGRRELLEALEHWEERLQGKLEESADGATFRLRLRSGFSMMVEQSSRELVFARAGTEGARALATAISADLRDLGIAKSLA